MGRSPGEGTSTWCKELTHLKRPGCWERLRAGGEGDNRGWDSWMASPTQWTCVWVNSRSWWWTGKPGTLQCMGLKRVGPTEWLNWTHSSILAGKIPCIEETGGLQPMRSQRSQALTYDFPSEGLQFSSVQFSHSDVSNSLRPHELLHDRPPCPSPTPGVHSDSHPWSRWCHSAISSSVVPFSSRHQSIPASESFPVSQLFTRGGQSTGVSALASFLSKNTQDWTPLGWTGWISLQSKGLSRVFSNTTVQKHQFFSAQLSSNPTLI